MVKIKEKMRMTVKMTITIIMTTIGNYPKNSLFHYSMLQHLEAFSKVVKEKSIGTMPSSQF